MVSSAARSRAVLACSRVLMVDTMNATRRPSATNISLDPRSGAGRTPSPPIMIEASVATTAGATPPRAALPATANTYSVNGAS